MKKTFFIVAALLMILATVGAWFYLQTQRNKATNEHIMLDMNQLAIVSYIYSTKHPTYTDFCSSFDVLGVPTQPLARGPLPDASMVAHGDLTSYICNDSAEHWATGITLPKGGFVCIDDLISYKTGQAILVSRLLSKETSCASLPSYILPN